MRPYNWIVRRVTILLPTRDWREESDPAACSDVSRAVRAPYTSRQLSWLVSLKLGVLECGPDSSDRDTTPRPHYSLSLIHDVSASEKPLAVVTVFPVAQPT
jgi:hypothetical protein